MYAKRRRRESQQLGGLITASVGIGMRAFLIAMLDATAHHAYFVGLIPMFIGVALLEYAYLFDPKL